MKDYELGKFNNGSIVFRQTISKTDALITASLEDRLNTPVKNLDIVEDFCRCIPCKSEFDKYEYGSSKYELGHKPKRGAFMVWVVFRKEETS